MREFLLLLFFPLFSISQDGFCHFRLSGNKITLASQCPDYVLKEGKIVKNYHRCPASEVTLKVNQVARKPEQKCVLGKIQKNKFLISYFF